MIASIRTRMVADRTDLGAGPLDVAIALDRLLDLLELRREPVVLGAGLALVLGHEIGRDILWSQGRQGVEGIDLIGDEAEDVFPGFVELSGLFEDRGLVLKRRSEVEVFECAVGRGFRIDRVVLQATVDYLLEASGR